MTMYVSAHRAIRGVGQGSIRLEHLWEVVELVRERHLEDVVEFLREGHSEHDCYEINTEIVGMLRRRGVEAWIDRLRDLKHYVARVRIGDKTLILDAVPELSGRFTQVLENGFVGTDDEALKFYGV